MTEDSDKSNVGYTLFRPTAVKHEYPVVDLQKDTVDIEGSVEELKDISMDKESYIRMFKRRAEFFIENNISNPKKYYEQFK